MFVLIVCDVFIDSIIIREFNIVAAPTDFRGSFDIRALRTMIIRNAE